ncbi:MAG: pyridoxal-phosphate dependent enzyme [Kofleriaceae bacterium]|nr:pyridoxal-phosphate dependent enzyme [Kofleriaceae bacterium]
MTDERVALFRHLPRLAARVPMAPLGHWPTPLDELRVDGRSLWVKREGDSSPLYGGNKVRTLEAWLGHVRARGAGRIWAIGAYGSNHAVATVLHARALGLDAGAIVFPQPASPWAIENAGALIASGCPIVRLRNVVEVPFAGGAVAAGAWLQRLVGPRPAPFLDNVALGQTRWSALEARLRRTLASLVGDNVRDSVVMPPGGATPIGTIGALSAAFELADQIAAGVAPPPVRIVLAVGSTCTTAGLVAGLALAHAAGAWRWPVPIVHAVRVTPWPVTSRFLILQLAATTLARIAALGGPHVELGGHPRLVVDGGEIGRGYGRLTARATEAMSTIAHATPLRLDGVYSGKAAAALLRLHREGVGPLVFWATKSSVELSMPSLDAMSAAPRALARWMDKR